MKKLVCRPQKWEPSDKVHCSFEKAKQLFEEFYEVLIHNYDTVIKYSNGGTRDFADKQLVYENLAMAHHIKKLFDMQIPMKPKEPKEATHHELGYTIRFAKCPICGMTIYQHEDRCLNCGQVLAWEKIRKFHKADRVPPTNKKVLQRIPEQPEPKPQKEKQDRDRPLPHQISIDKWLHSREYLLQNNTSWMSILNSAQERQKLKEKKRNGTNV